MSGRWIQHPFHGHLIMLTEILTEKQQFHTKANDLIKDYIKFLLHRVLISLTADCKVLLPL